MKKIINHIFLIAALFFCTNQSYALECNSPCPDSCAPSRVICEGSNCVLYCGTSSFKPALQYTYPGISFGYSGANGSVYFSESYTGYFSPQIVISAGKYHKKPFPALHRPPHHNFNKPLQKPHPGYKPGMGHKPAPKHR